MVVVDKVSSQKEDYILRSSDFFDQARLSLDISSLPNSLIVSLLHVPYSSISLPLPHIVPLLTYIYPDLSFLANSNPFFIPFSFARKVYSPRTPSFSLSSPFSISLIYSTVRNTNPFLCTPNPPADFQEHERREHRSSDGILIRDRRFTGS